MLSEHRYQTGSEFDVERPRLIEYFVQSRYDGLIKIELTDTKMTEYYQERSDRYGTSRSFSPFLP